MKWHRLFGLALTDFFSDSSYTVEVEKDLSLKQQYLDVIVIRKSEESLPEDEIPDGFENLKAHNLITYKSYHEPLDAWALDELTGHYVNYRKQISPSLSELFPAENFQLYAICTRLPEKLMKKEVLHPIRPGIYGVKWGSQQVRVIVLSRVLKEKKNSIWHLFGAVPGNVQYGAAHYQWHIPNISTVISQLYERYQLEGIKMAYTVEDYFRDLRKDVLESLTLEERLQGVPPEDLVKGTSPKELLKWIFSEDLLEGVSVEDIEKMIRLSKKKRQKSKQDSGTE